MGKAWCLVPSNNLATDQAKLLVVVQDRVHASSRQRAVKMRKPHGMATLETHFNRPPALNPQGINGPIKHDPVMVLASRCLHGHPNRTKETTATLHHLNPLTPGLRICQERLNPEPFASKPLKPIFFSRRAAAQS